MTNDNWELYAHITRLPVETSHYVDGYSSIWIEDTIEPCSKYANVPIGQLRVRVTMGSYVDYFKPTGTLCDMFSAVGKWYDVLFPFFVALFFLFTFLVSLIQVLPLVCGNCRALASRQRQPFRSAIGILPLR